MRNSRNSAILTSSFLCECNEAGIAGTNPFRGGRTELTAYLLYSSLIIIGILFSYLLQHYRIISRGTSEGISPYFVLLGVTSANSQFANILALPQSRADVECCKQVSGLECAAGLLGIAQIGVQWICFAVM